MGEEASQKVDHGPGHAGHLDQKPEKDE
jgi:hypothetical protein